MTAITTSRVDTSLAELVDRLTRLVAEEPDEQIEAFIEDQAGHAEELRKLLPMVRSFVQIGEQAPSAEAGLDLGENSKILGDFRIIREIGRGGMGIVYEAEQISLRRRVALKVLPFAAVLDPRHLQRFKNEAIAAASLDHPNIVEVHAVGCERGVHFYAMRYVEGQTLAAVIEGMRNDECGMRNDGTNDATNDDNSVLRTPYSVPADNSPLTTPQSELSAKLSALNPELRTLNPSADTVAAALSTLRTERPRDFFRRVAELGIQAAEALDHAHQMGIVHRDIKPANLMLENRMRNDECGMRNGAEIVQSSSIPHSPFATPHCPKLWITDFGLARIQTDAGMTLTGDLLGTLRYMSPEQALAKRITVDHRTDIYSLGITLYELLALQPAFNGSDREEVLRQIAFKEPTPLHRLKHSIPVELETIIHKAISKNPDDRYTTARDLADDLARFCADQPIRAKPPTRVERTLRWCRRHVGLVSTAAFLLFVVAVAALTSTWFVTQALNSESEARRRAQSNLRRGNQAVERLLSLVAEEQLLDQPHLETLRRALLIDALEVNKSLMEENSDDPEARFETAKAYHRAGRIQMELVDYEAADESARTAIRIIEELLVASPNDVRLRLELASVYNRWSINRIFLGVRVDDQATFQKAVALHEELLATSGDDAELLSGLVFAVNCFAFYHINLGGAGYLEMEALFRRSLMISEQLRRRDRDNVGYIELVSRSQWFLGNLFNRQGRRPEAEEQYRLALSEARDALEQAPRKSSLRQTMAEILTSLSSFCADSGDRDSASTYAQEAKSIAEQLVADYPTNEFLLHTVLEPALRNHAAVVLEAIGKFDEALEVHEQILKTQRLPTDIDGNLDHGATPKQQRQFCDYQFFVERIYRKRGDIAAASKAIGKLLAVETNANTLNNLAWRLATSEDPQLRDPLDARKVALRAIELAPRQAYVWNTLGVARYRTGEWKASIASFEKSLALHNGKYEAFDAFFLAMTHWQLGQRDDAHKWHQRAVAWMKRYRRQDAELLRFRAEAEELLGIKAKASKVPAAATKAKE